MRPVEGMDDRRKQKERDEYAFPTMFWLPRPDKITARGMARTFQNIRLWKTQTVFDNADVSPSICGAPAICLPRRST